MTASEHQVGDEHWKRFAQPDYGEYYGVWDVSLFGMPIVTSQYVPRGTILMVNTQRKERTMWDQHNIGGDSGYSGYGYAAPRAATQDEIEDGQVKALDVRYSGQAGGAFSALLGMQRKSRDYAEQCKRDNAAARKAREDAQRKEAYAKAEARVKEERSKVPDAGAAPWVHDGWVYGVEKVDNHTSSLRVVRVQSGVQPQDTYVHRRQAFPTSPFFGWWWSGFSQRSEALASKLALIAIDPARVSKLKAEQDAERKALVERYANEELRKIQDKALGEAFKDACKEYVR